MIRQKTLDIVTMLAFGVNLAAAYVIAFVWTPSSSASGFGFGIEQMYLFLHIAIVFFTSFLFGAVTHDIARTLIHTIGAVAISVVLAIAIITSPTIIFSEYSAFMDTTMTVAVVTVARFFIVGATFLVIGTIIGTFFGSSLEGLGEPRGQTN
jgi:hypothetical protein